MLAEVPIGSIVLASLVLLALVFAGWLTVWQVRRRLTQPDESSGAGFTLSDLRRLHKSGQMAAERDLAAKAAGGGGGRGEALRSTKPPGGRIP